METGASIIRGDISLFLSVHIITQSYSMHISQTLHKTIHDNKCHTHSPCLCRGDSTELPAEMRPLGSKKFLKMYNSLINLTSHNIYHENDIKIYCTLPIFFFFKVERTINMILTRPGYRSPFRLVG